MKLKIPILLIACLSLSCSTLSPKNELAVAEESFIGLAKTMHALKDAGQLSAGDIEETRALLQLGSQWLDRWHESLKAGHRDPEIVAAVNVVLARLTNIQGENQ